MNILITGGLGFIGSHCCIELIENGYNVIIIDNLSNSKKDVLNKIYEITGTMPFFYNIDIRNYNKLIDIFIKYNINCVLHCAAFKSVNESNEKPLEYYENNIIGTINILKCMKIANCKNIVFSSSCTVYGNINKNPISEDSELNPINVYGKTKLYIEELLKDLVNSNDNWNVCILRYFNPVGAHSSGKLGENPNNIPTNLIPCILSNKDKIIVYGGDYPTKDGTCIRDYIHVMDLAKGHILAISKIIKMEKNNIIILNLGTGKGYSVLEVINMMEKISGKKISYIIENRRIGDITECYANSNKAFEILGWKAEKTLEDMCKDSWRWYNSNNYIK